MQGLEGRNKKRVDGHYMTSIKIVGLVHVRR